MNSLFRILCLPTFLLIGCNIKVSNTQSTIKAESSVLQARIDSGYFDKKYNNSSGIELDKSYLTLFIKHEYSIVDEVFNYTYFPELEINSLSWTYLHDNDFSNDLFRMEISVHLVMKADDSSYVKQIIALTKNKYIYDVCFERLTLDYIEKGLIYE